MYQTTIGSLNGFYSVLSVLCGRGASFYAFVEETVTDEETCFRNHVAAINAESDNGEVLIYNGCSRIDADGIEELFERFIFSRLIGAMQAEKIDSLWRMLGFYYNSVQASFERRLGPHPLDGRPSYTLDVSGVLAGTAVLFATKFADSFLFTRLQMSNEMAPSVAMPVGAIPLPGVFGRRFSRC